MKENKKRWKAYIASEGQEVAFASGYGKTATSAVAALKRRYSPYWREMLIWACYIHDNGAEERYSPAETAEVVAEEKRKHKRGAK